MKKLIIILMALADTYVPAAINIKAIPVGVYFQILNRQMIHSGSQQGEMPAMQHG